ncbi:recombinase family protein [Sphingomonas oryzagri]
MLVGYARVSTVDQMLDVQLDQLSGAGCEKVFSERLSGTTTKRPELQACLEFMREGDVLVVCRLDRFARSSSDLHRMIASLVERGIGFRCLQQSGIDTTTPQGKLMLAVLGGVAEFENDIRKERQREGIEKAKAVNRRPKGTPYRRAKRTPLRGEWRLSR